MHTPPDFDHDLPRLERRADETDIVSPERTDECLKLVATTLPNLQMHRDVETTLDADGYTFVRGAGQKPGEPKVAHKFVCRWSPEGKLNVLFAVLNV